MKQIIDLSEKKILVTGASSGIGRETAILLSQVGAAVVLVGRNKEELNKTLSCMTPGNHYIISFDLSEVEKIKSLVQEAVGFNEKKLDGLVHCAGMTKIVSLKMLNYERLDQVMRVNFYSFIELMKCYSAKKNCNGGSIVAVSSTAAIQAKPGQIAYASSKAAINASILALSKELAKKDIRVNGVMPGFIRTKMSEDFFLKAGDDIDLRQLLGIGEPVDIANIIAFLLSDAARFITGANYRVDGGKY